MPDREKVIKGLECCTNGKHYELPLCYACPYSIDVSCMDYICSLHQDALDLLKAQEPQTVSGWVSVKDRMPDESGPYLVMLDNVFVPHLAINVHYWNAKDEYWRGSEAHSRIVGISHWMPLPEPPKEVSKDG